jgi:hypothetical protein
MNYDTEMPPWREMGVFTDMMESVLSEKFNADPGSSWLKSQKRLLSEGIIITTREGNEIVTFREYLRVLSGYPLKNYDRWNEPALVCWENVAENIVPDPPKPEAVFTAEAAGLPPEPPTAADAAPAASTPPAETPPTPPTPPTPAASGPTSPDVIVKDGKEIPIYDEDSPPEPDMSQYEEETQEATYHAYAPIQAPKNVGSYEAPMDELVASMQAIYMRLTHVMFDKCQFNGGGSFANPAGVLDPVSIADIPHAIDLVHSCESVNQYGQSARIDCKGSVKGTVHKRVLVAQNPSKQSKSAIAARNGAKIAWVINGDLTDQDVERRRAQGKKASKFIAMVKNGQYITLN